MTSATLRDASYPIIAMFAFAPTLPGYSDSAESLVRIVEAVGHLTFESTQTSIFLGAREDLKNLVWDYYKTRNQVGWDGYDALPITDASKSVALHVIERLPSGIQKPDVLPSPLGGLSLEWEVSTKIFSLEIENNELIWSFIDFGNKPKRKRSGIEEFVIGNLPSDLLKILQVEFAA